MTPSSDDKILITSSLNGQTSFLQDALSIRRKVFVDEQKIVTEDEEFDCNDTLDKILSGECVHLIAKKSGDNQDFSGTMRVRRVSTEDSELLMKWKVERVCVLSEFRGQGIARALMDYAMQNIILELFNQSDKQKLVVVLHSQAPVVPFYRSCGFKEEGEIFLEENYPHQKMTYCVQK